MQPKGTGPGVAEPLPILVVSSWYPNVEDPAAGRFVADQAVALRSTDRVAPRIVSFDPVALVGGITARTAQLDAVHETTATAIRNASPVFETAGFGVAEPIPTARLGIADGAIPALGTTAAVLHRRIGLAALAERILADGDAPAIVHAHTGFPDGAAAAELADRFGCPLVITEHATFLQRILAEPGQRAAYEAACARASRIVAVSELLAAEIRSALPQFADRVVVIPNAVAVDEFPLQPATSRVDDELLFVGYRKPVKGIDVLLEAFAAVVAERPGARLRLIGGSADPEVEARLLDQAARLGVSDRVSFEGPAGRGEVAAAMARASVFVHPSRYETFGVVAAEALAAGLPVVATNSGGVAEIMGDEPQRLGALVPVDDANALAAAIVEVLARRASFDPASLRAAVDARFGGRAVASRLVKLYAEVLAESNGLSAAARPEVIPGAGAAPAATSVTRVSSADGPGAGRERQTVVVGLDRAGLRPRLDLLPSGLRARLTVVTARDPNVALPAVGRVVELDVASHPGAPGHGATSAEGRLGRVLRHPIATARRRLTRSGGPDAEASRTAGAVTGALDALAAEAAAGGASLELVFIDGRDVLAVWQHHGDFHVLGGSIRRLADRSVGGAVDGPG